MKHALIVMTAIAVSVLSLQLVMPYVWIFLTWFFVLLYATFSTTRPSAKPVWFNIAVVMLTLGVFEAYLWTNQGLVRNVVTKRCVDHKHDILGYSPRPDVAISHARYFNDQLLWDVVYTFDSNRLRASPPSDTAHSLGTILFFGGSFTFGSGVQDHETAPFLTGMKTHGMYRVYNFAYRGYGPHQMLSAIEQGMVQSVVQGVPNYAIYQCVPGHVMRCAGMVNWDQHGPRYVLDENGKAIRNGRFGDQVDQSGETLKQMMSAQLRKSLVLHRVLGEDYHFNPANVRLFLEVIDKSKRLLESRYPGIEFHVLFWDHVTDRRWLSVTEALIGRGMQVHLISEILPDFPNYLSKYAAAQHDGHPNALAHEILAEYISQQIVGAAALR